jgi:hypothetical protein
MIKKLAHPCFSLARHPLRSTGDSRRCCCEEIHLSDWLVYASHLALDCPPAKFSGAVELAVKHEIGFKFEKNVLPPEFIGRSHEGKQVITVENSWAMVREIVKKQVEEELKAESGG